MCATLKSWENRIICPLTDQSSRGADEMYQLSLNCQDYAIITSTHCNLSLRAQKEARISHLFGAHVTVVLVDHDTVCLFSSSCSQLASHTAEDVTLMLGIRFIVPALNSCVHSLLHMCCCNCKLINFTQSLEFNFLSQ